MANPRLPVPGQDDGIWGEVLNEYLLVAHNTDGTLRFDAPTGGAVDEVYVANAIQGKANRSELKPVATSGSYSDLTGKPTLSAVAATGAYGDLTGKPTLSTVAATGSYTDLTNKPAVVLTDDARLSNTRTPSDNTVSTTKLQDESVTEAKLSVSNLPDPGDVLGWDGDSLAWETPAAAPVTSVNGDTGAVVLAKADVGLSNVDNTNDASKPISTATQTALNAKANTADLAPVATSNSYIDLDDRPSLATVAATGMYDELSGLPDLKPVATSGNYADLTGRPALSTVATSGAYNDLTGRPTLPTAGTGAGNYAAGNDARITGALQSSTVTTKGDLLAAAGSGSLNRVAVGSNGQVLTADSSQSSGVRWASPVSGGISRLVSLLLGDMTAGAALNTDYVYIVGSNYVLTLPTASSNSNLYTIKNRHTANITVATTGGETVDGGTLTLAPDASVTIVSDGTNWVII